jgi:hypothetical protein
MPRRNIACAKGTARHLGKGAAGDYALGFTVAAAMPSAVKASVCRRKTA